MLSKSQPAAGEKKASELPLLERLSDKLLPELKVYIERHRGQVQAMVGEASEHSGLEASGRYARVIDGLLSAVFLAAKTAQTQVGSWCPVALSAVGSYARCTLSLYSDLDVRLVVDAAPEAAQQTAEALLYPLWDAGLSVGHQVVNAREVVELARTDLPTATSILDYRFLAGERRLDESFRQQVYEAVFGPHDIASFLEMLANAVEKRKERFGGSVFLLEPDIKNGAGGLRDLDVAGWATRARWRVDSIEDLVGLGVLLPEEWNELSAARNFIIRLRNVLHLHLRRRVDRLGFLEQEALCASLGYGQGGAAVESLMSDYYRHAREIERASEIILHRAVPPPSHRPSERRLRNGLVVAGDKLRFGDPDHIFIEPSLVFTLYEEAITRGCRVSNGSRRAISRAVTSEAFCEQLRADPMACRVFRRLVCTWKQTRFKYGSVLVEMHDVGLLLAMIPEFAPVVGRVHHDVYHVYTVDVHSIAAVDYLRSIYQGAAQEVLGREVVDQIERHQVLFFATLLHDIGKDVGGRQHAERGADLAAIISARLHFDPGEVEAISHLIRQHLVLYLTATRRDIDDPKTLHQISDKVLGLRGLRELYLLTLADVATTSPGTLNPWKRRMLDELYLRAESWLREGGPSASNDELRGRALRLLPESVPRHFAERFTTALPDRYITANSPTNIAKHITFAFESAESAAAMRVLRREGTHVEIAVVADDRAGLLAAICAVLSMRKLKVVAAQVYSASFGGERKRAFDCFWVHAGSNAEEVEGAAEQMSEQLVAVLDGTLDVRARMGSAAPDRWSQRPAPAIPVEVRIDHQEASAHTIVEVISKDRSDLLYWIAETIHRLGYSIELAKIHTEGHRVTDVFYVRTQTGGKLEPGAETERFCSALGEVLARLDESKR